MHPDHPEGEGVGFREGPFSQEGTDHRGLEFFRQGPHFLVRFGNDSSVPYQQERPFRAFKHPGHGFDAFDIDFGGDRVSRQVHGRIDHFGRKRGGGNIFGQINQNRAGPVGVRDKKRFFDDPRDIIYVIDQIAVLDDRHSDADDIRFLERVFPQHGPDRLSRQDNDRNRIHHGGHNAGHGVGGSGAAGYANNPRPSGHAGVTVGHMHRRLFVPHQDQFNF